MQVRVNYTLGYTFTVPDDIAQDNCEKAKDYLRTITPGLQQVVCKHGEDMSLVAHCLDDDNKYRDDDDWEEL